MTRCLSRRGQAPEKFAGASPRVGTGTRERKKPFGITPKGFFHGAAAAYLAALTMYSMAARMSSSDAVAAPPLGGIAPLPCMATLSMASMPVWM